ncbi:MAG: hypothetical protein IPN89_09545 [Saprospiraceae bacterium]|nr:hypothetical protein [Saprospiraceae bacterium]
MKTLKFLFVSMIVFGLSHVMLGQSYDYTQFRFPDVKIKGINTSGNLSGGESHYRFLSESKSANTSANYNLNGNFFSFTNNAKTQKRNNIYFNHSFRFNSDRRQGLIATNNHIVKSRDFYFYLSEEQVNRKFLNDNASFAGFKNLFLELDHNVSLGYANGYTNDTADVENNYSNYNMFLALPIKVGFGRIEPMNDLFLAQFLMDDLLKEGLISEKFSQEKLFELAQLMSYIRNQRVFDFRRSNIYQLTEIAGWMEKNNIPQNIKSFTIMNDNWQNAYLNTRNHGKRVSVGFIPWLDANKYSNNFKQSYYGLGLQLEFSKAKAVSQYLQRDLSIYLTQHYQSDNNNVFKDQFFTQLLAAVEYSYNPNSRTTYSITPSMSYYLFNIDNQEINASLRGQVNYFINNKTRILASLTGSYLPKSDENNFSNIFYNRGQNVLPGRLIYAEYGIYGNKGFNLSGEVYLKYNIF